MNRGTLSVAGSRKTQSIVDACSAGNPNGRRLVLTYTRTGQAVLEDRLRTACAAGTVPEVMGWYSFLLHHMIRPYLPLHFPGQRLNGLNFDGNPGRYAKGPRRFLDSTGRAFRIHLSRLAVDVANASKGLAIDRLSRIYSEIHIDEVQDLTGCDLRILEMLMKSTTDLFMVGDVRQSVYDTNPHDPNLKQYRGVKMLDWFTKHQELGLLEVAHASETWRSNQGIADFSDSVFPSEFAFEKTVSRATARTEHDGVFAICSEVVPAYVAHFNPLCLRASVATARDVDLPFRNFGKVKGLSVDRVLIYPTRPIVELLTKGKELNPQSACGLYVAVTRARHSVAFVVDKPEATDLQTWTPPKRT